jgi:polyisoprenoid-binding protein YceI
MKKIAIVAATLLSLSFSNSFAQTWGVDKAHSRFGFGVSHLSISQIDGNFKSFDATINSSKPDFSDATFDITADMASINTDIEQRDAHLKSPDFLDVEKYPTLTFKSTSFKKVSGKNYKLSGNLTMHGVTKPVTIDVVINGTTTNPQSKKTVAGIKFTGKIKRSDFGIATGFPASALGEDLLLIANAEFTKN